MTQHADTHHWRALHAFLPDPTAADAFLTDTLPLALGAGEEPLRGKPWFFIRYGEGGAHIRLRFAGADDRSIASARAILSRALRPYRDIESRVSEFCWPVPDGTPRTASGFFRAGEVVEQRYEPETLRYGGPQALPVNEQLFATSTALAIRVIEATRSDPRKRGQQAVDFMLACAAGVCAKPQTAVLFFEQYAAAWRTFDKRHVTFSVDAVPKTELNPVMVQRRLQGLVAMKAGDAAGAASITLRWLQALSNAIDVFRTIASNAQLLNPVDARPATDSSSFGRAIAAILASQMHMMNNRLGITPREEYAWSEACASALSKKGK